MSSPAEQFGKAALVTVNYYQGLLKSVESEKQDVFDALVAMNHELCALRDDYFKENNNV